MTREQVVKRCLHKEAKRAADKKLKRGKYSEEADLKLEVIRLRKVVANRHGHQARGSDLKAFTDKTKVKGDTPSKQDGAKPGRKSREPCSVPGCRQPNSHVTSACWLNKQCDKCNEVGHIAKNCPNMKVAAMEDNECEICGTTGHEAQACPSANFAAMLAEIPDDDNDGPPDDYEEEDMYALTSAVRRETSDRYKDWVCLDSGAGVTGTRYRDFIEEENANARPVVVTMANGTQELSRVQGRTGPFGRVILVESLTTDLASVRQLTATGHTVTFQGSTSIIEYEGKVISRGKLRGGQFLHAKADFMKRWKMAAITDTQSEGDTDDEDLSDESGAPKQHITGVDRADDSRPSSLGLEAIPVPVHVVRTQAFEESKRRVMLGHVRQGHPGFGKMYRQARLQKVNGAAYSFEDIKRLGPADFHCHICSITKQTRLPRYSTSSERAIPLPGTEWCLDLKSGLPRTVKGETCVLCAVDRGSGATLYFPMKHKEETVVKLKELCHIVKTYNMTITAFTEANISQDEGPGLGVRALQTDDEPVFVAGEVAKLITMEGLAHKISAPYIHEQNGHIESAIRTDFATVRACLAAAKLKKSLWAHALKYVSQTRFVTVGSKLYGRDQTPHETWLGYKPDISHLRPFGAACYHLKDYPRKKGKFEFDLTSRVGV